MVIYINYLNTKARGNPMFSYTIQVDNQNCVTNFSGEIVDLDGTMNGS